MAYYHRYGKGRGRHPSVTPTPVTPPVTPTPPPVTTSSRIYGVTLTSAKTNTDAIVASLVALPHRPTVRIVFDIDSSDTPASYLSAVQKISAVADIMGQLLDSTYVPSFTASQTLARCKAFYAVLGSYVSIWEVGNEINGSWLGANAAPGMIAQYDYFKALGVKTALTLYLDCPNCLSLTDKYAMLKWSTTNVPANMKSGLDYVLISYYEDDNENYISYNWNTVFASVRAQYPSAYLGIGECGTTTTGTGAVAYIHRYYRDLTTVTDPKFIWGGFWWYFDSANNMVPKTLPNFATMYTDMAI